MLLYSAMTVAVSLNPMTRVATLLENMTEKLEKDMKAERDLYKKFACWCQTIEKNKNESNDVATQRITDLEGYIDDITNGRVEFTTEREDLVKEIAELNNQLEEEKATRDKSNDDFKKAEEEMKAAVGALTGAITTLGDATADAKSGVLLNLRFHLRRALDKNSNLFDAESMMDSLLRQVPANKEWDKMDADKATFNKEYKGRSFKIQGVLQDMKTTFEENLKQSQDSEKEAQEQYDSLREKKEKTLKNREEASAALNQENAARNKTRAEAEAERDELVEQKEDDTQILKDTKVTCNEKKNDFDKRQGIRTEEIAAVSQALTILRSDDARDSFNKSFESQMSFIQVTRPSCVAARKKSVMKLLRSTESPRMVAMSLLLAGKTRDIDNFPDNVLEKIDAILADLETEGTKDEENKNECEKFMATKKEEIKEHNFNIGQNNEEIDRQKEVVEKKKSIAEEKKKDITLIQKDVEEADEQRAKENANFNQSKLDDEEAVRLIEKASEVLKAFYEKTGALIQMKKVKQHQVVRKELPAPPPETWDEDYGGAKESNYGIMTILAIIKDDIKKDITTAEDEEAAAVKLHDEFVTESEGQIEKLNGQIDEADLQVSEAEKTIQSTEEERDATKDVLAKEEEAVKAKEPGCTFITKNFDTRKRNRAAEVDGLEKAKGVLKGANFGGFLEC